jgi:aldehyde dehydrogenase (NAD+)
MTNEEIKELHKRQQVYYRSGATLPVNFRIEQLKKLYSSVKKHQIEINNALKADLGKSAYESFMCESGLVLTEISYMLSHIKKFAARKTVPTPLAQFPAHSYRQPVPYGNTLIMSPWNYPFLLSIEPLVNAISAGNTAIIKPSAYSPATSKIIKKIIEECFL